MKLNVNKIHLRPYRRKLRRNSTPYERTLWLNLRNRRLAGKKFRRQYSIGNFIYDFYCPEERLVIELDGEYIHANDEVFQKDEIKQKHAENLNLKVLRYANKDITDNLEAVLEDIRHNFKQSSP